MIPRLTPSRSATVALCLTLVLAAGCTTDQPPQPTPLPPPAYEPAPPTWCTSSTLVTNLADKYGLGLRGFEPTTSYRDHHGSWGSGCVFSVVAKDDRFATALGPFEPHAHVTVTWFDDARGAREDYRNEQRGFEGRAQRLPRSATGPAEGWWDEGWYEQRAGAVDPGYLPDGDRDASQLHVNYAVRHRNVVIVVTMRGVVPDDDVDDAYPLLHDMARTLIDETRSHLTLSPGG